MPFTIISRGGAYRTRPQLALGLGLLPFVIVLGPSAGPIMMDN